jgi:Restriction endonuclease
MARTPLWKAYEHQIFAALKSSAAKDAEVAFDCGGTQRLPGRFSGINRQIDVLVRGTFAGFPMVHTMVVDCKLFNRRLAVTHVEAFAGLVTDVGAQFGLLITCKGFSRAAKRRAEGFANVQLDVVELDELERWIPRKPIIAMTTGVPNATLTYIDEQGSIKTDVVSTELARRLLDDPRWG